MLWLRSCLGNYGDERWELFYLWGSWLFWGVGKIEQRCENWVGFQWFGLIIVMLGDFDEFVGCGGGDYCFVYLDDCGILGYCYNVGFFVQYCVMEVFMFGVQWFGFWDCEFGYVIFGNIMEVSDIVLYCCNFGVGVEGEVGGQSVCDEYIFFVGYEGVMFFSWGQLVDEVVVYEFV